MIASRHLAVAQHKCRFSRCLPWVPGQLEHKLMSLSKNLKRWVAPDPILSLEDQFFQSICVIGGVLFALCHRPGKQLSGT